MRIGIDGRTMSQSDGKGVYTRSVLLALRQFDEHEFTVYGHTPVEGEAWPANWKFRPVEGRGRTFRELEDDVLFSPVSFLTTILSRKPTLTTVHDLILFNMPVKMPLKTLIGEKLLTKPAIRRSAALTVQTESVKQDLLRLAPGCEAKVSVVPPGVAAMVGRDVLPPAELQGQMLRDLDIGEPFLLFVGTLQPRKNVVRLINAFERMPNPGGAKLVLAGSAGWPDAALRDRLERLPPNVVVTGRVSNEQLATLYDRASAVVCPSLYEGVGYPVLEGYYWEKPVITSNTTSLAEIGRDAALLVDPTSEEAIAKAISQVLEDEPLRSRLTAAGRLRLAEFSWDTTAKRYLEILRGIA